MADQNLIRESRIFNITEKVFTIQNIRELASVIWNEHLKFLELTEKSEINFSVKCFDKSHYQSEDISLFDGHSIVSRKRAESIKIMLTGPHAISLNLVHGKKEDSYFDISSNDNLWVNGMTGRLNEVLDGVRDQEQYFKGKGIQVSFVFFIVLTIICTKFLDFTNGHTKDYVPLWKGALMPNWYGWDLTNSLLWLFAGGIFSLGITARISEQLDKLFPNIELQIGPDFKQIEKKRREFYFLIATLIIIPLLISLLLQLFT